MDAAKSVGTEPFQRAREAFDKGMPLVVIAQRFNMNTEELRDMAPEAFAEDLQSENEIGGY